MHSIFFNLLYTTFRKDKAFYNIITNKANKKTNRKKFKYKEQEINIS